MVDWSRPGYLTDAEIKREITNATARIRELTAERDNRIKFRSIVKGYDPSLALPRFQRDST
jgi:hypothetical protein